MVRSELISADNTLNLRLVKEDKNRHRKKVFYIWEFTPFKYLKFFNEVNADNQSVLKNFCLLGVNKP